MSVPLFPGVPALPFGVGVLAAEATLLTFDSALVVAQAESVIWGIFQNGNAIITGDSVRSFEFRNDYDISDYPVEQGGFYSFNKVASPFDARIIFMQGGDIGARADFLDNLSITLADLNLYTIITPEIQYASANIVGVSYRRTAQDGVTLLSVEVRVREVRSTADAEFSNTAQPDGAAQQNNGTVAPQQPDQQTSTAATGSSPGVVQSQVDGKGVGLTNSIGNTPPAGTTAAGSTVTYDGANGPTAGVVQSVRFNNTGYILSDTSFVPYASVNSITPVGKTQVQ